MAEPYNSGVARVPFREPDWFDGANGDIPRWRGVHHDTHCRKAVRNAMAQGLDAGQIAADPTLGLSVAQVEYLMKRMHKFDGDYHAQGHGVHGNHARKFGDHDCVWFVQRLTDPRSGCGTCTAHQMCTDLYLHRGVEIKSNTLTHAFEHRYDISLTRLTLMNKAAFTPENVERTRRVWSDPFASCFFFPRPACFLLYEYWKVW